MRLSPFTFSMLIFQFCFISASIILPTHNVFASFLPSAVIADHPLRSMQPKTPMKPAAKQPAVTGTNGTKEQPVSEEDINRFTNSIILIKDFYVQPTGDRSLLDDAIR